MSSKPEDFAVAVVEEAKRRLADDLAEAVRNWRPGASLVNATPYANWLWIQAGTIVEGLTDG